MTADEAAGQNLLGIVEMANGPLRYPGNLGNAATFDYPVVYAAAATAYTDRILQRDPAVADDYIRQGLALQERGINAMLTTCGFNVVYQQAIANGLDVPVATSSLLLLPLVLRLIAADRSVGVITFDRQQLDPALLRIAGVSDADLSRLHIAGLDGTRTWHELRKPQPDLPLAAIEADLLQLLQGLIDAQPTLGAILFECSALVPFGPQVRGAFGLPVFDFLSLADLLRNAAADLRPFRDDGRGG